MNKNDIFIMDFPIPRTHCGIPLGNGNMGALIWGDERLHITVNRADFWDHRGGELLLDKTYYGTLVEGAKNGYGQNLYNHVTIGDKDEHVFAPQRLPFGRFEFTFKAGDRPLQARLDYHTGVLTVITAHNHLVKLVLGTEQNMLIIDDPDHIIAETAIKTCWNFDAARDWLQKYAFETAETIDRETSSGWVQACPADPSLAAVCSRVDNHYIISLSLGDNNSLAVDAAIENTDNCDREQLINLAEKWWHEFWVSAPQLNVPDDFYNRFFNYALWKFGNAANPASPKPCGLQGPWVEEYQRASWSADYHFNVNIQQIYTLAFGTGKFDHLMPLFNMLESVEFRTNMRHNAKVLLGIDDGLLLTHAVDDRGFQCGGMGVGAFLDPACGAWTAQLYWHYYKYTLDDGFLLDRAYPFMCGIMRVFEEMLEKEGDQFVLPLAISAEYGCNNPTGEKVGKNPSYQFAAIHFMVTALIEAATVLSIEPKAIWLDIQQNLPQINIIKSPDATGQLEERIAIWDNQDLDICHRHHSHLAAVYPFDSLAGFSDREYEILDNSIDHWVLKGMGQWSEWCYPWAAIIQARQGFKEAPVILLNIWREIFINEGLATVYLPKFRGLTAHRRLDMIKPKAESEIMQLDGTMGGATALLEMMVHQKGDRVCLFPAVPEKWENISFDNIFIDGAFTLSAVMENGVTAKVKVKSRQGGMLKIVIDQHRYELEFKVGEEKIIIGA
jgi:alpha-L-fucosidase 2